MSKKRQTGWGDIPLPGNNLKEHEMSATTTRTITRTVARVSVGVVLAAMSVGLTAPASADTPAEPATVLAAATTALPTSATALPYGPNTCKVPFVWREAYPGDVVCVTTETRAQTRKDNAAAAGRIEPGKNGYGPKACAAPFVWRQARPSDLVCVMPEVRAQAAADNAAANERRAAESVPGPQDGKQNVVFELLGSGTADAVVTSPGTYENYKRLPFRKEMRVSADVPLLQVHTSGSHASNVRCRITVDSKVVVQGGNDCVFDRTKK
jgi:hypothetical protein